MTRPLQILAVEDNPSDISLIGELLREELQGSGGASTLHVVRDGIEALDYLYGNPPFRGAPRPDLVLLDLNLPRKSGLDVLREIKGDPALTGIPVLVFSSSSSQSDVNDSYALNANCYLVKPMDYEQFTNVIAQIRRFWLHCAMLPSAAAV